MLVVSVPMLTNAHDLETGVELLCEVTKNKKKQTVAENVNWITDQMLKEKAATANAVKEKKRKANELSLGGRNITSFGPQLRADGPQ